MLSFISSTLKVIPNTVCPFWSFEPSVNISMFSLLSFNLISFLFTMLILYYLFIIEKGVILSVFRFGFILITSLSNQSIFSCVV